MWIVSCASNGFVLTSVHVGASSPVTAAAAMDALVVGLIIVVGTLTILP